MRSSLRPPFGHPLPSLPPGRPKRHAAPLDLVHVCAHGTGERETQARRGLLLVGTAEVHGKEVLWGGVQGELD